MNKDNDLFIKYNCDLTAEVSSQIYLMKLKAEDLLSIIDSINNREMSLAKTNLEQAVMWATKAIILDSHVDKK